MSDETPNPAVDVDEQPDPAGPDAATDAVEDPDGADTEEESNPNAEAAKWRHRFKDEQVAHHETRQQLDSARSRLEALQRQHVEGLIEAARVKPAAVWAVTELAALVGEDGTVDSQAVNTAIDTARQQLGIQPLGKGNYVPRVGHQPDGLPKTDAFVDAFKPRRR